MKQRIEITFRDTGERPVPIRKPRDPRFDSVWPSRSNWELYMTRESNAWTHQSSSTPVCEFCAYIIVETDWKRGECMLCRNKISPENWAHKFAEAWEVKL